MPMGDNIKRGRVGIVEENRELKERIRELEAAANDLIAMVDGHTGAMRHGCWRDEKGARLKDIPEYVALYVLVRKELEGE